MNEPLVVAAGLNGMAGDDRGFAVVTPRDYVGASEPAGNGAGMVINLCPGYRYGSLGYHCSLLAEARGQAAFPTAETILGLATKSTYRHVLPELDELLRAALGRGDTAEAADPPPVVDVVFGAPFIGETPQPRLQDLARRAFELFPAPLLRLRIARPAPGHPPRIVTLRLVSWRAVRTTRRLAFLAALAAGARTGRSRPRHAPPARAPATRHDLAILHNPREPLPPSWADALDRFVAAGRSLGVRVELIQKKDYPRLTRFDALFIRETTRVNHHTYRFARAAAHAGMPVIDDPESIVRCTNKVFLAELLRRNGLPTPRSLLLDRTRLAEAERQLGYPLVLKIPDGCFSRGVYKVHDRADLEALAARLFRHSELLLAQEFVPTEFDWRIGVLNRRPLFACQYFMRRNHWQVNKVLNDGRVRPGGSATFLVEDAPAEVVRLATAAANLIGDGFYGVDLKETPRGVSVIEINDNPSVEHAVEGARLKEELYRTVIREFVRRIEAARPARAMAV